MHILAASRSLPFHGIGGMEAIAWDLLTEFVNSGHRVTVLTAEIPDRPREFIHSGVDVVTLKGTSPMRYTSEWWRTSREYTQAHLINKVEAVLSISVAAAGLIPLKSTQLDVPFLFQAHGSSWGEALSKWQSGKPIDRIKSLKNLYWFFKDARLYPGFDELILVGGALRRQFEDMPTSWITNGIQKTTILNGVDPNKFRFDSAARNGIRARSGWDEQHRVIVFSARLNAQKGGAEAIRAFSHLLTTASDYRLLVIGEGNEERSLRRLAMTLKCNDKVLFYGPVQRQEIPALFAASDVFLFPSLRKEGLPMSVLEALSVGLPCVCSDEMREVFSPDLPIFYANPRDFAQLAEAIRGAALAGVSSRSRLPEEYTLRYCAEAYIDVIDRLRNR